jgi:hypothetical protein
MSEKMVCNKQRVIEVPGGISRTINPFHRNSIRWAISISVLYIFIQGLLLPNKIDAYQEEEPVDFRAINWAYAAAFGTGVYEVRDDLKVFVFHVEPRWTKQISWKKYFGDRPLILELRFPATFGVHDYNLGGIVEEFFGLRLKQVSFAPGAVLELPMSERWALRPHGHLGWGTQTSGDRDSAWIYWGGIKSRLKFPFIGQNFGLLNGLAVYAYKPEVGTIQDFTELLTGLECDISLGKLHWQGEQLFLRTHLVNHYYFDHLKFLYEIKKPPELSWEWELGISLGKKSKIKLWIFHFERIGIAYRYGRETQGIRFYTRSTFKQ